MLSDDCLLLPQAVNHGMDRFLEMESKGRKIGGVAFYYRNWPVDKKYYVQKTLGGKLFVNHGMYLKKALQEVNYADEETYIFYKADGDLCLRMWQAGYEIIDCPGAFVEHYYDPREEVRRTNQAVLDHDRNAYLRRWDGIYYRKDEKDLRGREYLSFDDPDRLSENTWSEQLVKGMRV